MALPKLARNTLHSSLAGATMAIGNFLGVVIVARLLGPDGAGAVALAIWIVGAAVTLCDLGLPLTLARFVPELTARGQMNEAASFSSAFFAPVLLTTILGVALCGVLTALQEPLSHYIGALPFDDQPPAIWVAVGWLFTMQAIGNYGLSQLRGVQRFDLAARLSTLSLGLQIVGVLVGASVYGAPGALIGYSGGSALLAFYALARIKPRAKLDAALRRRAWSFALSSWGVGLIAAIVWSRTEIAFLNHWRGAQEAGLYAAANTLALVAAQAPLLMTGGLLAHFSEHWALGDRARLQNALASALRLMAFLIFPACFGMAAIAPSLAPLLFGPAFAAAAPAATILVAAQSLAALSTISSALLFAVERNRFLVWIGVAGAIALIAGGFFIVPTYGVMGAVGMRVAIQTTLVAAAFVYVAHVLGFDLPWGALFRTMVAASLCALAARAVATAAPGLVGLIAAILVGALVYVVAARWLRVLPAEDTARIAALSNLLPGWLSPFARPVMHFLER